MNETQFLLLQDAVQWAADENDMRLAYVDSKGVGWYQAVWALGMVAPTSLIAAGAALYREVQMECGSACCLAGTGVLLAGATVVVPAGVLNACRSTERISAELCITTNGEVRNISAYAQEVFGLGYHQAEVLFSAHNDINDLIRLATRFAADAGFELMVQRKAVTD